MTIDATHQPSPTHRPAAADTRSTLVWDAPVRVFHGLMVLCFAGAWLTAERDRWQLLHATLGYTMVGLVVFRLLWGLVGTRHARFASFVRGPAAVQRYLGALLHGRPEHHVGHNPAGAVAIVLMLLTTLAVGASGWGAFTGRGGEWLEELHEGAANGFLLLVLVHVAGVVLASLLHRENLIGAMVSGRKRAPAGAAAHGPRRAVAVVLLAAVLGFWYLQWQAAPADWFGGGSVSSDRGGADHDGDDD